MTGFYISRQHGKKIKMLKALESFFFAFSQFMPLTEEGIAGCIKRLSRYEPLRELAFLKLFCEKFYFGCDVRGVWNESISEDTAMNYIGEQLRSAVVSFSDYFGNIPMDVFCRKCEAFGEMLSESLRKENEKWERSRTLILSSGVFGAAAVFLILI